MKTGMTTERLINLGDASLGYANRSKFMQLFMVTAHLMRGGKITRHVPALSADLAVKKNLRKLPMLVNSSDVVHLWNSADNTLDRSGHTKEFHHILRGRNLAEDLNLAHNEEQNAMDELTQTHVLGDMNAIVSAGRESFGPRKNMEKAAIGAGIGPNDIKLFGIGWRQAKRSYVPKSRKKKLAVAS